MTSCVVVAGPTAAGKSALAVAIAREFRGTAINADAMQLYRDIPILSAQPDAASRAEIPHALFGVLDACDGASAGRWRQMALEAVAEARAGGRLPVVVGGTGLYLRALMKGLAPVPPVPPALRAQARALHQELGGEKFRAALAARDPEAAARLSPGDTQRLIRAYEVVLATGRTLKDWQRAPHEGAALRFATVLLMPPREALHAAIDARFLAMMEQGALAEARALHARGLDRSLPALKAVGVAQLLRHLDGAASLPEAVAAARRATRAYAKRQITWFRKQIVADLTFHKQFSERLLPEIFSFIRGLA